MTHASSSIRLPCAVLLKKLSSQLYHIWQLTTFDTHVSELYLYITYIQWNFGQFYTWTFTFMCQQYSEPTYQRIIKLWIIIFKGRRPHSIFITDGDSRERLTKLCNHLSFTLSREWIVFNKCLVYPLCQKALKRKTGCTTLYSPV